MAKSDFFTFASEGSVGTGDLMPLDDYAKDSLRLTGFRKGVASRALINRTLRQSSHMGAVLARFVADALHIDVADDGDVQALADNFAAAVTRFTEAVAKGEPGKDGAAATITIGTVTATVPGGEPAIENIGTPRDAVLNITLPRGSVGPTGEGGAAATITIGTVTALPPGEEPTVDNVGTPTDVVLNFSIPRGDTGMAAPARPFILSADPPEDTNLLWVRPADRVAFFHDGTAWRPLVGVYAETTAP